MALALAFRRLVPRDRDGDDALVSQGSESGLPRSIPELVRNVVGWALSLARSRAPTSSQASPPFLGIADTRDATVELSVTSSDRATSRDVIGGAPEVDGSLRTSSRAVCAEQAEG
jgi:hypothetical protein